MTTTFTATMIMSMTSGRGKTEPAAAAEAAKAAEVAAVATVRADNNQQRAVKTAAAAIAVGKRCQARGEKRGQRRRERQQRRQGCGNGGRSGGGGGGSGGGGSDCRWGEARGESGDDWGST